MSDRLLVRINGRPMHFDGRAPRTLLQLLRDEAGLTGTKEGCGNGECGACAVMLDRVPVRSCLVLAQEANGADVVTVEGLAADGELSRLQDAFVETGAVQCGFCAPGFLIAAHGLLRRHPDPTRDQILEAFGGHLCRCTGYEALIRAVELAAQPAREEMEP